MAPSNGTSVSLARSRRAWVGAGMVSTCSTRTAIDLAAGASSTSKTYGTLEDTCRSR